MQKKPIKALVSIGLAFLILFLFVTGLLLWLMPSGKAGQELLGVTRGTLKDYHLYGGFLIFFLSCVHLYLNYGILKSELKKLLR